MKDMNGQTILLISDMRQVYLAEILTKKGMSVRCLDIRNSQTVEEQLLKLKKFLAGAAMLVLPIPVTKVPEQERLNEILNKNLANDTLVLGGCFTEEQRELLDRRGIRTLILWRMKWWHRKMRWQRQRVRSQNLPTTVLII